MDEIIKDVNEGWDEEGQLTQFKGSDDYLRQKVSETSARDISIFTFENSSRSISPGPFRLSSMPTLLRRVKETTWSSPKVSWICAFEPPISHSLCGTASENDSIQDYNPLWISELRRTNAYEVWERVTDPLLFDIAEPR